MGTPTEICDALAEISEDADFDGIAIREVISPLRTAQIVDQLVPELRRRNMMRSGFRFATLRQNLFDDEA